MATVILKQEGDSISIVCPTDANMELTTDHDNYRVVDTEDLPKDRTFRDAWRLDGSIDLRKAKEIWRSRIVPVRAARLNELDIKWMKAMESGNVKKASAIANEKQILRDITEREELTKATTVEEIQEFWPDVLKG